MPYSLDDKLEEVDKIINNVRVWLATHGKGGKKQWPDHEIEIKERRLDVMKAVKLDLETAIDRKRER